jgi:hypothetical protein
VANVPGVIGWDPLKLSWLVEENNENTIIEEASPKKITAAY